jgi:threonine dehydrogenase-like Zn-dependent dehydrogenase
MLAAVYHGPEDLRLEQRPLPAPGPGELVLRVSAASICATDLRILRGAHRKFGAGTVRVPGHEVVGTIAAVGAGVGAELAVGQRVFVAPNVGCGHCRPCRRGDNNLCANYQALGITLDGAFAEFLRIPAAFVEQGNVMTFPDTLDGAAVALAEPFACVLRGQRAVQVGSEDVVLILGAGPIGVMHVLAAKAAGAAKVVVSDRLPARLAAAARRLGDRVVDVTADSLPEVMERETEGAGADVVIVAAGVPEAMASAPALAAIGGRINFFAGLGGESGIHLDANLVHYRELIVTGTTGCSTADCRRSLDLISTGKVDLGALVSARFELDRIDAAFALARSGQALKVVVQMPAAGEGT